MILQMLSKIVIYFCKAYLYRCLVNIGMIFLDKYGVKLQWKTAVFSKLETAAFCTNLVQLNSVVWFMHLDLMAHDRLSSNFINYQQNKAIIDKKIKPGHST